MTDLRERYGRRTRPRWLWLTVAGVGIALGVAWAAWVGFQHPGVNAELRSYDVIADDRVEVTVEVYRPDPVAVRCTVYAQAADYSVVGEKSRDLPAGGGELSEVTVTVETSRPAVNGVLRGCQTLD